LSEGHFLKQNNIFGRVQRNWDWLCVCSVLTAWVCLSEGLHIHFVGFGSLFSALVQRKRGASWLNRLSTRTNFT